MMSEHCMWPCASRFCQWFSEAQQENQEAAQQGQRQQFNVFADALKPDGDVCTLS